MIQRVGWWVLAAALLGGCQAERYRSMQIGSVDYDRAFAAAVDTVEDFYPLLSADRQDGMIITAPRRVAADGSGLSRTRGREWAEMRLRRDGPIVWADIRVTVEHRVVQGRENLSRLLVPYRTGEITDSPDPDLPYLDEEEAWTPVGTNTRMEWRILEALRARLYP
ncbi:MAG: hypothetical protein GX591_15070 [Planctomycetes bacterium]|nr:hypothetical protein [Planctomycetota bacterium]